MMIIAALAGCLIVVVFIGWMLLILGWVIFQLVRVLMYPASHLDWTWKNNKKKEKETRHTHGERKEPPARRHRPAQTHKELNDNDRRRLESGDGEV